MNNDTAHKDPAGTVKPCSRCGKEFLCLANDISKCDCRQVQFTTEQLQNIKAKYNDCLCISCLREFA